MNGFLIDTNALPEYNRPGSPNSGVRRWLETTGRPLQHVSVITLAEIQKEIELLQEGRRRTNSSYGSGKTWKHGLPDGFCPWTGELPPAGHPSLPRVFAVEGPCLLSTL